MKKRKTLSLVVVFSIWLSGLFAQQATAVKLNMPNVSTVNQPITATATVTGLEEGTLLIWKFQGRAGSKNWETKISKGKVSVTIPADLTKVPGYNELTLYQGNKILVRGSVSVRNN
ncbi:MAG: hypothetical protein QM669_11215 [Siphonobacter sp.]